MKTNKIIIILAVFACLMLCSCSTTKDISPSEVYVEFPLSQFKDILYFARPNNDEFVEITDIQSVDDIVSNSAKYEERAELWENYSYELQAGFDFLEALSLYLKVPLN